MYSNRWTQALKQAYTFHAHTHTYISHKIYYNTHSKPNTMDENCWNKHVIKRAIILKPGRRFSSLEGENSRNARSFLITCVRETHISDAEKPKPMLCWLSFFTLFLHSFIDSIVICFRRSNNDKRPDTMLFNLNKFDPEFELKCKTVEINEWKFVAS